MRLLHEEKNRPWRGVPYGERTLGDMLEEFYIGVVQELVDLKARDDLAVEEETRKAQLVDILEGNIEVKDRKAIFDLTEEESDEVWETAHKTGDPLADYWERQIARGEEPDFDLTEVPEEERD